MEDFGLHFCTRHAILIWQHSRQLVERDVAKYFLFSLISFFFHSTHTGDCLLMLQPCLIFVGVLGDACRGCRKVNHTAESTREEATPTSSHIMTPPPCPSNVTGWIDIARKGHRKNLLSEVWCTYRPLGKVSLCNVMHQEFKQRSFWVLCSNEGKIRECISDIKFKKRQS